MQARCVVNLLTALLLLQLSMHSSKCNAQVLRFASYNMLDNPTNSTDSQNLRAVLLEIGNTPIFGATRPLDLLGFQEGPAAASSYNFVEDDFEAAYGGNYAFTLSTADFFGCRTGFIYNVNTLQLLNTQNLSAGLTHNTLRAKFRPVGGSAADEFYIYSIHFRAGADDEPRRGDEAEIIRNDADSLPAGSNIVYVSDCNMRGSDESGWIELFSAGGVGQAYDSYNTPFNLRELSNWNDSVAMQNFQTQNPVSNMDDRFDIQIFNAQCFDGSDFEYVKGSVTVIGNNGTHNIGSGASSGNLPSSFITALTTFSDHLPVIAEYEFGVTPTTFGQSFDVAAIDNFTVQPSGPRTGAAGTDFFNIEGDDNGTFASFGVIDFDLSGALPVGQSADDVGDVSLKLFQSNAGFTEDGPVSIYLASPTATNIPIDASVQYQSGNDKLASVPPSLSAGAEFLGTYAHFGRDNSGSIFPNGTLDQIALNGTTLKQAVADSLNGSSSIRLILTPEQGETAATFTGFGNTAFDGPMLTAEFSTAASAEVQTPNTFNVVRGLLAGGMVADLSVSDDLYVEFNPGFTLNSSEPPVWLEFTATTQIAGPSSLDVRFEAGANTPGLVQTIEVFNYTAGVFEEIESRPIQFADEVSNFDLTGNLARFVSPSGEVQVRGSWRQIGFTLLFPWEIRVDHVQWSIDP